MNIFFPRLKTWVTTFLSKYSLKIPVSRLISFYGTLIYAFVWVNKNAKKNEDNCPAILTEQAWLIKDWLDAQKQNFFLRDQHEKIPGLPTPVANQNARFASSS